MKSEESNSTSVETMRPTNSKQIHKKDLQPPQLQWNNSFKFNLDKHE